MTKQLLDIEFEIEPITMEQINIRIKQEICYKTLEELTDEKLMGEYKECNSVKNEIQKLKNVLNNNHIDEETTQKIVQEYLLQLIPAGTKGVIRGNKFNEIVKLAILEKNTDSERFEIRFEESCKVNGNETSEKPDWYILEQ